MSLEKDTIVVDLNDRLSRLLVLIDNELQQNVLELKTNPASAEKYKQLRRVSNSLEQYVYKNIGLFYVGLLGSFSSGKSSTINSLLELWDSDKKRSVGINPTDTQITLITHPKNTNDIFSFSKEGNVSIRTKTDCDSDFLKKIVLMDTPGSGDPNILSEIVRDSLPLCDLIIYTLNASAPFSEHDRPFLEAQQAKLKNIPLMFVITRGEEFRADKSREVSKANFDAVRYNAELSTLLSRVNEAIDGNNFSKDDFLIIDNSADFNIDELRRKITERTTDSDEARMMLHTHKLAYFRNEVEEIYRFYTDLSASKTEQCRQYIAKTESNIDIFDRRIDVSKNRFRKIWDDNNENLKRVYSSRISNNVDSHLLPDLDGDVSFEKTDGYEKFIEYIDSEIYREAKIKSTKAIHGMELKLHDDFKTLKDRVKSVTNLEKQAIDGDKLRNETFVEQVDMTSPVDVAEIEKRYLCEANKHQTGRHALLKRSYENIAKTINNGEPSNLLGEYMDKYRTSIAEVLDGYYDAVQMYRAAVFASEGKSYVAYLGLADKLDDIERADINKERYNIMAEKELVDPMVEKIDNYRAALSGLKAQTGEIDSLFTTITAPRSALLDSPRSSDETSADGESMPVDTHQLTMELVSKIDVILDELKDKVRKIRKIGRRRFWLPAVLILALCALLFVVAYFWRRDVLQGNSLIVSIVGSIIAPLITGGFARLFYNSKEAITAVREETEKQLERETAKVVEDYKKTLKASLGLQQDEIMQKMQHRWKSNIMERLASVGQDVFAPTDNRLLELRQAIRSLVESYRQLYTELHEGLTAGFSDTNGNVASIEAVASQIKSDSIQPSFALLNETSDQMLKVRDEIEKIGLPTMA